MILIIENNLDISSEFEKSLKEHKIKYMIANSGVEAYKILCVEKYIFDYIITNIGLPDENGIEIVKFAKEKHKSKIIIYSGKKYTFRKRKYHYDFYFKKKDKTPSDIIKMIVNNNLK